MTPTPANWFLGAPFIRDATDPWLTRFVPNADHAFKFHIVPGSYSHDRSRKVTGLEQWKDLFQHGFALWNSASQGPRPAGVLTCFPQLAITVALRKQLASTNMPLVAWNFNLGKLYTGARRHLARGALGAVDRFIVHSRSEVHAYSEWLDLPASRFQFVPLQRAVRDITFEEEVQRPFLLSMGSAQRDYRLLFAVLAELGYPAVVVAGAHAVAGLSVPGNVEVRSGLSAEQCFELVQRARLSVIPVANQDTASGQVTLLEAMMYGRPVIITSGPACLDYVTDRSDAILVRHGDHEDMKQAIQQLWEDEGLRAAIGRAARQTSIEKYSDEAIGRLMGQVLREVGLAR